MIVGLWLTLPSIATLALCIPPVVQQPLHPYGGAAQLASLPMDFLCPTQGPFQNFLLVGKVPWEYWSCHHEAFSNCVRVASPIDKLVCSRCAHTTHGVGPSPDHYTQALDSLISCPMAECCAVGPILCLPCSVSSTSRSTPVMGACLPHHFDPKCAHTSRSNFLSSSDFWPLFFWQTVFPR